MLSFSFRALGRFVITPRPIAKHVFAQLGQRRVVFLQFRPGVDMVMQRVVFTIVVKPVLGTFGPVFFTVLSGEGALPQSLFLSRFISLFQSRNDLGVQ